MEDSKLKKEAPFLFSIEKKNIYQLPEGFFGNLEREIRNSAPGNVRKLKRWFEFSAAAVIVFIVLFSGIKIIAGKKYMPVETDRTIYNITDGDMDGEKTLSGSPKPQ